MSVFNTYFTLSNYLIEFLSASRYVALEAVEVRVQVGYDSINNSIRRVKEVWKVRGGVEICGKHIEEEHNLRLRDIYCLLEDICKARRTMDAIRLRVLSSSKGVDADAITYEIVFE